MVLAMEEEYPEDFLCPMCGLEDVKVNFELLCDCWRFTHLKCPCYPNLTQTIPPQLLLAKNRGDVCAHLSDATAATIKATAKTETETNNKSANDNDMAWFCPLCREHNNNDMDILTKRRQISMKYHALFAGDKEEEEEEEEEEGEEEDKVIKKEHNNADNKTEGDDGDDGDDDDGDLNVQKSCFEVEKILDYSKENDQYLIKWKYYPSIANEWLPAESSFSSQIEAYWGEIKATNPHSRIPLPAKIKMLQFQERALQKKSLIINTEKLKLANGIFLSFNMQNERTQSQFIYVYTYIYIFIYIFILKEQNVEKQKRQFQMEKGMLKEIIGRQMAMMSILHPTFKADTPEYIQNLLGLSLSC
ncbi:hypothetical protein RFI_19396 [Reticulomyxa filosa]|uniref:Chromo domain-containing protein n=1 Tax=Reticulomyxa filosa TaxID=46433 RepID=X6MXW8_RETFI|nr:hypothetical protein RFI_19396 [Reticulomyxa filosa]|eukprot:ETO17905.1 hypothetical protein RFI_19396 [Reticulomyxa filosa]